MPRLFGATTKTEQASRSDEEDDKEQRKVDDLFEVRRDVVTGEAVDQTDNQRSDQGTRQTPETTKNDNNECRQHKVLADGWEDWVLHGKQA